MAEFIISLGGSIVVPESIDEGFLKGFRDLLYSLVDRGHRFILIIGGGATCRRYQKAASAVADVSSDDLDWIGIAATRLNAEMIRGIFSDIAYGKVINDPEEDIDGEHAVLIGAGFKPGSSTDLRAVQLGVRFNAKTIINISNVDHVYDSDPYKNPDARSFDKLDWDSFRKIVGDDYAPGSHWPFDPVASSLAQEHGKEVVIIGKDIGNLKDCLEGRGFTGTRIS